MGQTDALEVEIEVLAAENVPPSIASGGPYVLDRGQALQLQARATDGNLGCGDEIAVAWDLDGDGEFDDAVGATPVVNWDELDELALGEEHPIRVRVEDAAGESAVAETTLTIYPGDPVARGRANPNPAGCNRRVVFDGSASDHPNPERRIVQYEWDVDGRDGWDGGGRLFRYRYRRFGSYDVTLRVTDDLGRTATTTFRVEVNLGNRPPLARTSRARYTVLEGDDLTLDGSRSIDRDAGCGDRIVEHAWDLDDDGDFDGDHDLRGARPTVAWADLVEALQWDGNQRQIARRGDRYEVTLRVSDTPVRMAAAA